MTLSLARVMQGNENNNTGFKSATGIWIDSSGRIFDTPRI